MLCNRQSPAGLNMQAVRTPTKRAFTQKDQSIGDQNRFLKLVKKAERASYAVKKRTPVQTFSRMGLTKRKVSGESCEKVQFSDCRPLSLPCGCRLFIRSSSPLSQPLAVSEHQWCAAEFWESLTVGMNANSGPDPEMYPSRGLLSRSAHDGH